MLLIRKPRTALLIPVLTLSTLLVPKMAAAEELPAPPPVIELPTPSNPTPSNPTPSNLAPSNLSAGNGFVPFQAEEIAVPQSEVVTERYPNRQVKIERHVRLDAKRNYINHGPWKMYDPQGKLIAHGEYKSGERHGTWMKLLPSFQEADGFFQPPYTSQAEFVDGQLEGTWTVTDSRHRVVGTWEFSEGRLHGTSTYFYPGGQPRQELEFKRGVLDGTVTTWRPNGRPSHREFFRNGDQLIHEVTWHDPDQKKTEGWKRRSDIAVRTTVDWWLGVVDISREPADGEPVKIGEWTEWYANGSVKYKGRFRLGEPVGEHAWWHPNGQKMLAGEYQDGLREGLWTRWHGNGLRHEEGLYAAGEKDGTWRLWSAEGALVQSHDVDADELVQVTPELLPATEEPERAMPAVQEWLPTLNVSLEPSQ